MNQENNGSAITHVRATIGSPLELKFTGPEEVADEIAERYKELSMDALDCSIFSGWKKFAQAHPSTKFAIFGDCILVNYEGTDAVLNVPLSRPSEAAARTLAEKYALPMADEAAAQAMRDEFEASIRQKKSAEEERVQSAERFLKQIRTATEMRRSANMLHEGKFALVDGRIFIQIGEGVVGEMTPAPDKELSHEVLREMLEIIEVPFVEGEEAIPFRDAFEAMETKIDLRELVDGRLLRKAASEQSAFACVPQAGGLVVYCPDDDGDPVFRYENPALTTEQDSLTFAVKFSLPIAEGEEAEIILKLYSEQEEEAADEDAEEPVFG